MIKKTYHNSYDEIPVGAHAKTKKTVEKPIPPSNDESNDLPKLVDTPDKVLISQQHQSDSKTKDGFEKLKEQVLEVKLMLKQMKPIFETFIEIETNKKKKAAFIIKRSLQTYYRKQKFKEFLENERLQLAKRMNLEPNVTVWFDKSTYFT